MRFLHLRGRFAEDILRVYLRTAFEQDNDNITRIALRHKVKRRVGRILFYGIDQNIISHQHRSPSKSPETNDNARAAHIPYTLAALPAASGLPARF